VRWSAKSFHLAVDLLLPWKASVHVPRVEYDSPMPQPRIGKMGQNKVPSLVTAQIATRNAFTST
jgi:hypothetical protein